MTVSEVIEKMALYFGGDVRRINHALKVYGFAKTIAGQETMTAEERLVTELAAVLHDIGIREAERKYQSCAAKYQELEGPPVVLEILEASGFDAKVVQRVCYLVGHHHTYSKIDGVDFQTLVEADFLVNIFEDAIEMDSVSAIREKYFKTAAGTRLLDSMYSSFEQKLL
jgi:HD superfamily phosphodiesterase